MSGTAHLTKKAMEDGALSGKAKELMAAAIRIVVHAKAVLPIMSMPRRRHGGRC
jgi:hypothetical protein